MTTNERPTILGQQKVTWVRTEKTLLGLPVDRISHPTLWVTADPGDGYERFHRTKADAVAYVEGF